MTYTKTIWKNSEAPAINETNLNHIETGISDAHTDLAEYEVANDQALADHVADTSTHGVSTVVGVSDAQTLTNKTLDADENTITNVGNTEVATDAGIVESKLALDYGTSTLNQNLIDHAADTSTHGVSTVAGISEVQELTNKTIDADSNTLSNIENENIKAAAGIVETKLTLDYSTSTLNQGLIDHAADTSTHGVTEIVGTSEIQTLTNKTLDASLNTITGLTDTAISDTALIAEDKIDLARTTLSLDSSIWDVAGDLRTHEATEIVHGLESAVIGESDTQTLTNKTIDSDSNTILNISNTEVATDAGIVETKLSLDYGTSTLNSDISTHISDAAVHLTADQNGALDANSALSALNAVVDAETLITHQTATTGIHGVSTGYVLGSLEKAAANGLATLGSDGKIPAAQIPALSINTVTVVSSEAAQLALVAEVGDMAIRSDTSTCYIHNGGSSSTMADWTLLLTPPDAVLSVFGRTGAVAATSGDYDLGEISETAVYKRYTLTEQTKLAGIADFADPTGPLSGLTDTYLPAPSDGESLVWEDNQWVARMPTHNNLDGLNIGDYQHLSQTQVDKLTGIEEAADVTDSVNVDAAGAVMNSDYNANSILAATTDDTPAVLTVAEQSLVGRITGGNIAALTATQVRGLINVEDGATADQSADEILTALKTVDGPDSGLDADTLDGAQLSTIAAYTTTHAGLTTGTHGVTGTILGTEDKNVANGVAGLDGSADLYIAQMPALVPRMTSGTYVGNSTSSHAIAHGLGVTPKKLIIEKSDGTILYTQLISTKGVFINTGATSIQTYTTTAWTSTNFYPTENDINNNGITYYWVAFG